ncbi:DNA helicase PcrA [Xylocopilactobacillus apis]|uniref:ATP-dependent DNA helicase n=1 Tax=Xylocopilactobacillus apis TaxID=2932183 RepID=A0AAU9DLJ6_9LACO|nr:DNA helicase PcrA [Xylocopilactobacillus apis]BDR56449.1 DNA helicase [Xylocopilactobacillus apis]
MIKNTKSLTENMNDKQEEAIETTEGPLLIMAGAGSGKTRVLTHRIAYLIDEKNIAPWNILAITFTNKAASEMRERVETLLGTDGNKVMVSTFHSLCVRILRAEIDKLGYSKSFNIADTSESLVIIKNILKDFNIDTTKMPPRAFLEQISKQKNELITASQYAETADNYFLEKVATVFKEYEKRLKEYQTVDFDDLIMLTVNLFQNFPAVLEKYQERYQYIHVDEYQDTNRAQYILTTLLAKKHHNICVVGDADQSIYGWRGANMKNILNFKQDYPNAHIVLLEQNYRSTGNILHAANNVIDNNTERIKKKLWTDNGEGEKIHIYQARNENEEATFVVEQIQEQMKDHDFKYGDFGILFRTNAQSRIIEETLIKSSIPYQLFGGKRYYERKEILDVIGYLKVIANPDDMYSLQRIINVPKRGIGNTTLEKVRNYAGEHGLSEFETYGQADQIQITSKAKSELLNFYSMINNWRQKIQSDDLKITDLTQEIYDQTGYLKFYKSQNNPEAEARVDNLEEFLSVTKNFDEKITDSSFEELTDNKLVNFLTDLALVTDNDDEDDTNNVSLMTLHAAKGLEFPIVFIIGMEEGLFPSQRSIMENEEVEEERRLAYVGITRAKQVLYLIFAAQRVLYGRTQANRPSRFIDEIDQDIKEISSSFNYSEESMPRAQKVRSSYRSVYQAPHPVKKQQNEGSFQVGDKVEHKKWGQGIVVQVTGQNSEQEIDVAFKDNVGIKRLMASFAPITKV